MHYCRGVFSWALSLLKLKVLSLVDDSLNVYAFKERIVQEGSEIGAGWPRVWEVFKQELLEFFICHLFYGFRETEKEIEFVEGLVRCAHIIEQRNRVSCGLFQSHPDFPLLSLACHRASSRTKILSCCTYRHRSNTPSAEAVPDLWRMRM